MLHICTSQSASPSSNMFVDKGLQLQKQLKWWSLFSLITSEFQGLTALLYLVVQKSSTYVDISAGLFFTSLKGSVFQVTGHLLFFLLRIIPKVSTCEQTSNIIFSGRKPKNYWVDASRFLQAELKLALSLGIRSQQQWFMPPCSHLRLPPCLEWTKELPFCPSFHEGMCSTSSSSNKHSRCHRTVDMRLKMGAGKDKPANFLEQGFISFFAERNTLITVCCTALEGLTWFLLSQADRIFHMKSFSHFLQVDFKLENTRFYILFKNHLLALIDNPGPTQDTSALRETQAYMLMGKAQWFCAQTLEVRFGTQVGVPKGIH